MLGVLATICVLILAPTVIALLLKLRAKERDLFACNGMYGLLQASYSTAIRMRKDKEKELEKQVIRQNQLKNELGAQQKSYSALLSQYDAAKEHNSTMLANIKELMTKLSSAEHQLSRLTRPRCVRCGRFIDGYLDKTKAGELFRER